MEAKDLTRGTVRDIVERRARQQRKEEARKKLLEEGPQEGLQAHVSESLPRDSASSGAKSKGLQAHVSGSLPSDA
eukprot:1295196-Amphidinium_carterae.1